MASDFLKVYGDTEGPFGFPMKDADAKALDLIIQQNPGAEYVRSVVEKATTELRDGERADVSWIQTEAADRQGDIVLTSGFRDDNFAGNPIVTINHDYTKSPVGKSIWRKKVKEGDRRGVKAKTIYPSRPAEWVEAIWPSDMAWSLVKSGLMGGKSIGFLTIKAHSPTEEEVRKNPSLSNVRRIVDEWMLLEYCCCWLPVNPEAVVEAVSKSLLTAETLKAVGVELPQPTTGSLEAIIPHTPLAEIEKALLARIGAIDLARLVQDAVKLACAKARGAV